ncbi:MAG: metallophosphoesterase [bacterium]
MKINKFKKSIFVVIFLILGILVISIFWLLNKNVINTSSKISSISSTPITKNTSVPSTNSEEFVFAIQADPHMDENSSSDVYKQTLNNVKNSNSEFLVDLGDIFMVDKLDNKNETNIRNRYTLMKGYYDLLGGLPVYQVMGNHDGETGWDTLNTKNYRLEYFPDQNKDKNYYSIEKNNSLFLMLDPYTYTITKPNDDGWKWTLGKTQYDWLKNTLEKSSAKYKFVFIHQLVGGDNQGRGGIEFAKYFEWGGNNIDGSYGFDKYRSGWGKSIHQLLIDNNVNIVFKGHDHFYAKQEIDGIIYQTLPQPSHAGDNIDPAGKDLYKSGKILGGSGFLQVSITSDNAVVKYFKADGSVGDSYSL